MRAPLSCRAKISNGFALAVVQPDGTWEIHPLNDEKLHEAGWQYPPDHLFVDRNNQLWAGQRLYMHDDLTLVDQTSPERLPVGIQRVDSGWDDVCRGGQTLDQIHDAAIFDGATWRKADNFVHLVRTAAHDLAKVAPEKMEQH